jgi:hypothetical protein
VCILESAMSIVMASSLSDRIVSSRSQYNRA